MARKNAKGSSKQDAGADDTASNSNNGNSASAELEANAPPASLHGLDLSKYRQPALVEALDRLTSFTYAGTLLLKPALKIMWRSALYQDGEVRFQELVGQLIGNAPINEPPTPAAADGAVASASSDKKKPAAAAKAASRSLQERFFHFFFVGIPMAVLVGLATGIVNFVSCIWRDVMTVASTSHLLLSQAKTDLSYYMQHPESRPTKDEAINAWSDQIVQPYAQTIVKRKLGPFGVGFLSGPISRAVQALIRRAASTSATEVQHYAKKYKGFDVFQPEGATTQSSSGANRELR
jgi:hypothetical protein